MKEEILEKAEESVRVNSGADVVPQEENTPHGAVPEEQDVLAEQACSEHVQYGRVQQLEDKLFCIQSGVPEENCGVVIAAAQAMGNPDRKAAITEVLEKFPFFRPMREERAGITTGIHIEGMQGSVLSGVEEAFFAANPDCR